MTDADLTCCRPTCIRRPSRRGMCKACYAQQRNRRLVYGTWDPQRVPAQPVRDHIETLRGAGVGIRRIASLAGVNRKTLQVITSGRTDRATPPSRYITPDTAAKILAVPVPDRVGELAAPGARVPACGTTRRLQALVAHGYTQTYLAGRLGMTVQNLSNYTHDGAPTEVTARRALDVDALFRDLQLTPGPSERARRIGQRNVWALPLDWDEDALDDPDATPGVGAREWTAQRLTERRRRILHRAAQGMTTEQIAAELELSIHIVRADRRHREVLSA